MVPGFKRNFKPLEILNEEEVEAIHQGTLEVLERTGVRVEHERALKLFSKNGCQVDFDAMRVRIPPDLALECLRQAPSSFKIRARNPEHDLELGGDTAYFDTFPGMQILNLDTCQTRPATREENASGVIVLDALENLSCIGAYTPYFNIEGIPPAMAIPESLAAKIKNSSKALVNTGYQLDCEVFNIEMAKAVGTEIGGLFMASPPMAFSRDAVECAFRFVEAGFPVHISGGVLMGATAPATLAGATIVNNVQAITAVVLTQLIKPGTRVLSGDFSFAQEMRNGAPAFGSIEGSLHMVVFNQIWRRYGIPTATAITGPVSSKRIDFQAGYEKAMSALLAVLSGSNLIKMHGCVYGQLAWHPVQAILDDDIAGMAGRFVEGAAVSSDTLAVELIKVVGPIPGMYLDKEHTRKWWRKEQFLPKTADRLTYPEWLEKGGKSTLDYAKDRMEEILATHKPAPLTSKQDGEIERILAKARDYYKTKGVL